MLQLDNVSVRYGNNVALDSASLHLTNPGIHGIIGPNGSGKSTLMKAIVGLVDSAGTKSGSITLDNQPIDKIRADIAYVAQRSQLDMDFPTDVFDCVLMGTYPRLRLGRRPGAKHKAQAKQALQDVGMWDLRHRHISELSGGQFQRVLIARCLAQDAKYIFLDEPFVGIDIPSEKTIIKLLKRCVANGKTVVVVHHDMSTVRDYFDELVMIHRHIVAFGPVEEVFTTANLHTTFGSALVIAPDNTCPAPQEGPAA